MFSTFSRLGQPLPTCLDRWFLVEVDTSPLLGVGILSGWETRNDFQSDWSLISNLLRIICILIKFTCIWEEFLEMLYVIYFLYYPHEISESRLRLIPPFYRHETETWTDSGTRSFAFRVLLFLFFWLRHRKRDRAENVCAGFAAVLPVCRQMITIIMNFLTGNYKVQSWDPHSSLKTVSSLNGVTELAQCVMLRQH